VVSGSVSIRIKLFSTLREALGESEFQLNLSEISGSSAEVDVAAIKKLLSQRGADWKEALNQPNLVHALNHKVVFTDALISEGDELAFFPPMTGG
jgi:molybdopterin synthase sulfur carrier subunit